MLKNIIKSGTLLLLSGAVFYSCQESSETAPQSTAGQPLEAQFSVQQPIERTVKSQDFTHGPVVMIDGEAYYLAPGAPDGPNGATDIPGHFWKQTAPNRLLGKHYNIGPFGKTQWWSSDAPDKALLYIVNAFIDTWSMKKAKRYAKRGVIHYHEFVRVSDGKKHPTKVLWLRHVAVRAFTLDGGPHPELGHDVKPGIDWEFIPNGMMPYNPNE